MMYSRTDFWQDIILDRAIIVGMSRMDLPFEVPFPPSNSHRGITVSLILAHRARDHGQAPD